MLGLMLPSCLEDDHSSTCPNSMSPIMPWSSMLWKRLCGIFMACVETVRSRDRWLIRAYTPSRTHGEAITSGDEVLTELQQVFLFTTDGVGW